MKVYISPERRSPPHGKYWGINVYETDICYQISNEISEYLVFNGFETTVAPKELDIYQRSRIANSQNIDFYLAVHTNASTNGTVEGKASGTEMLAFQHPESIRANQLIYDELIKLYPSNRGLKNGNAYIENSQTNMVSAYCEIAFHDNSKDVEFLINNQDKIAYAIATGVCNFFGKKMLPIPSKDDVTEKEKSISLNELELMLKSNNITNIKL